MEEPFVAEDPHHPSLGVELTVETKQEVVFEAQRDSVRYNFRKADFHSLYDAMLKTDWSDILEINDVNEICTLL